MTTKKMVFIVGAGASSEAKLPTGEELKKIISNDLKFTFDESYKLTSGNKEIYQAINLYVHNNNFDRQNFIESCTKISNALPLAISIDNYMDQHRDNKEIQLCGKLAIAQSILQAESTSLLAEFSDNPESGFSLNSITNTWYCDLWKVLTENCQKEDLIPRFKSVAFVIFNYDRCIEHFLFESLKAYYDITPDEAALVMSHIKFHHPYGAVGKLPWSNSTPSIRFGGKIGVEDFLQLSASLRTFTEGTDPETSDIAAIQKIANNAEILIFLGFSFHPLNMKLLYGDYSLAKISHCYATAYGESASNHAVITQLLSCLISPEANLLHPHEQVRSDRRLTCKEFFSEYSRSLTLNNKHLDIKVRRIDD
jgi:hypothetical protein